METQCITYTRTGAPSAYQIHADGVLVGLVKRQPNSPVWVGVGYDSAGTPDRDETGRPAYVHRMTRAQVAEVLARRVLPICGA